jgi:hypothetical protein
MALHGNVKVVVVEKTGCLGKGRELTLERGIVLCCVKRLAEGWDLFWP